MREMDQKLLDGDILDEPSTTMCQLPNMSVANMTIPTLVSHNIVTYYICGPLLTVFIIIGLFGNLICVHVFLQKRTSTSGRNARLIQPIYMYLLTLALWDLILLVSSFYLYNLPEITAGKAFTSPVLLLSLPYVYYATNAAHSSANWVVLALGLERYFALCHPFKHRLLNGRRRSVYTVCVISMAGLIYSLPRLFETNICMDSNEPSVEFNRLFQNMLYKMVYKVVGGMFLYSVGPFLCLFVVSVRVSAAVRQQRLFQAERTRRVGRLLANGIVKRMSTRNDPNDCSYSVNVMLIAVMVKLLFVHSLPTALDLAEATIDDKTFARSQFINILVDLSILLVVVNSSCNFFVYYICSRQFRKETLRVWRRCGRCGNSADSSSSSRKTSENSMKKEYALILSDNSTTEDACRKAMAFSEMLTVINANSTMSGNEAK